MATLSIDICRIFCIDLKCSLVSFVSACTFLLSSYFWSFIRSRLPLISWKAWDCFSFRAYNEVSNCITCKLRWRWCCSAKDSWVIKCELALFSSVTSAIRPWYCLDLSKMSCFSFYFKAVNLAICSIFSSMTDVILSSYVSLFPTALIRPIFLPLDDSLEWFLDLLLYMSFLEVFLRSISTVRVW